MPRHKTPPMKRPYRVDAIFCNCYKTVDIIDEASPEFGGETDKCCTDPMMYEMQYCPYRNFNRTLLVEETTPLNGLEEVMRAECRKEHFRRIMKKSSESISNDYEKTER